MLTAIVESAEAQARDAAPVTNFLIAAGNGTADYGGNLFPASATVAAASADIAAGTTINVTTPDPQPITLGAHAAADTIAVATDQDAVYGTGDVATVNGFTIGATPGTSDMLAFLAGGTNPVSVTGVTGAFASDGTGQSDLTATASAGVLTFAGSAASADSLAQLLAATANILDTAATPANSAAAFGYGGSTYLVVTPSAPGAGGSFALATDHVFDLSGVTGATSIGTTAAAHAILA